MTTPHQRPDWMDSCRTYYWPGKTVVDEGEGYLEIAGSGWEGGQHWSGVHRIPLDSPELDFWRWLAERYKASAKMLTGEDVEKEREIFRSKSQS